MKHALSVLLLSLVLLSCERDHGDPVVIPPDAPGDDAPDTGPGPAPGAGTPLEPEQSIPCELDEGHVNIVSPATQKVTQRWTPYVARVAEASGTPWLCYDDELSGDCRFLPDCQYTGEVTHAQCSQASWSVMATGEVFVSCGLRFETDPDGDGVFTLISDVRDAHVAIVR